MDDQNQQHDQQPKNAPEPRPRRRSRKRGAGEGSISQRPDGRWQGRIMVGYLPDGRPDRRSVYGRTRAEAQAKLRELIRRRTEGLIGDRANEQLTLEAFLARWLEGLRATVRPATWDAYENWCRLHLVPALGRTRLAALRPDAIQRFYAAKMASGLAPRSVRHIHAVFHRALRQATRWGYLPHNPADRVDPPKVPRTEMLPPTAAELVALLDSATAAGDRFAPLWTVAVYSGCREGELLGLKWTDVDLERGTLAIRRTLLGSPGGTPQFGEPKTSRSRRTVSLPPEAVDALHTQWAQQAADRQALGKDYLDSASSSPLTWAPRSRLAT